MSNEIISESSAMNVHFNPFFIWNSYSFQTELPALLQLLRLREYTTLPFFVKSNTSQVFILSSGVFQRTTAWSQCQYVFTMLITLRLLSCEV